MMNKKNIGEILLEYELITDEELQYALKYQKEKNIRLGEALVELGKVTENDIEYVLSKQLDIPYVLIDNLVLDKSFINKFDKKFLKENRILPLFETNNAISIVTDDPFNSEAFNKIKEIKGKPVNISAGNGSNILKKLNEIFTKDETRNFVEEIENIIEQAKNSNYYRIDFKLDEEYLKIFFFNGKQIEMHNEIKIKTSIKDILHTLYSINVNFFYDIVMEYVFLSVFPAELIEKKPEFPLIVNSFGIPVPKGIVFADTENYGFKDVIKSDMPIEGYPYISLKKQSDYRLSINLFNNNN